jgi:hypothetical protein
MKKLLTITHQFIHHFFINEEIGHAIPVYSLEFITTTCYEDGIPGTGTTTNRGAEPSC